MGSEGGQIKQYVDAGKWPEHGVTAITQNAYLKTVTLEEAHGMNYRVCSQLESSGLGFGLFTDISNNGTGWPVYMPIRLIKDV